MLLMFVVNLTFGYSGVHVDIDTGTDFHQMVQGGPSSGFRDDDDDEQIVQCLRHVRILGFILIFFMSDFIFSLPCFFRLLI
jgi:hypothetical protein